MKIYTGTVKGQSIEKNRDGENDVRMLQVEITDPDDVQKCQVFYFGGEDNAPINDDEVAILEISEAFKVVVGVNDNIVPSVESGERKIYSRDDNNAIKANAYFKKDGQLILNGDGDFAVRFNELKTAFDTLQSEFDAHIHITTATVGATPTPGVISPIAVGSLADINTAKIDSIEVPS